jgi:membrane-bound lytic murein transglycosylase D
LAAYNAGEGAIQRAIERQKSRDFWKLRLPKETQLFVPAFMAMTVISQEPERYGFSPPPPEPHATETVQLSHPADLRLIAKAARTTTDHVRELNPALIRWATPPDHPRFALRIPAGLREEFEEEIAQVPPAQRVSLAHHKARKGDTTAGIARRYGVSHQALLDMNGLAKRQALKAGTMVLVPEGAKGSPSAVADTAATAKRKPAVASSPGRSPSKHIVKAGDTLAGIAKRYRTSLDDLCRWNDLQKNAKLRPGQHLMLSSQERHPETASEKPSPARQAKSTAGPKRTTASRTR